MSGMVDDDSVAAPVSVVSNLVDASRAAAQRGDNVSALAMADAAERLAPDDDTVRTLLAELRGEEAVASREVGTRRRVTVMFADLVGSTPLSVSLDPEATREILRSYHETCDAIIARYDGHIAHIMGDGILVIFGFPRAHEDDGLRAVTAALEMARDVEALTDPVTDRPLELRMRIGVHTGLAVISELGTGRWSRPGDITGETPNLASRVQTAAEPGTIFISGDTLRLVRGKVVCQSVGVRELKGIDRGIELFQVTALTSEGDERVHPDSVGRDRELTELTDLLRRSTSSAEYVVLCGEAGIGKSHLALRLRREAESSGGSAVTLRCSALDSGTPLAPVMRYLKGRLENVDDPIERLEVLGGVADRGDGVDDEAWFLLAQLAGVTWPSERPAPALTPDQARERTMTVLLDWIDRLAAERHLMLTIEDLHWADATTLDLVGRLTARDPVHPQLVLVTTRGSATSAPGSPTATVSLEPLDADQSMQLVDALTAGRLDDATRSAIAERGDGVPLYLRELATMLAEAGDAAVAIPPTLNDLLVARLDAFPRERAIVEMMAVFGRPIDAGTLARLVDAPPLAVQQQLDGLQRAAIVRHLSTVEYDFRHALLRDTAYEVQLLARRRELHGRVADVLEGSYIDGTFDEAHLVAYHLERSGESARAVGYWMLAGARRAEFAAHAEAIDSFERALALLQVDGDPALEFQCRSALAASLLAARGYPAPEVAEAYAALRDMAVGDGSLSEILSLYGLWAYYHVSGDAKASVEVAHTMYDRALRSNDTGALRAASAVLGYQLMRIGDPRRAVDLLAMGRQWESPVPLFPHHAGIGATANLAEAQWLVGRCATARALAAEAASAAEALTGPTAHFTRAYTNAFLAGLSNLAGRPDAAIGYGVRTVEISAQFGFASWLGAGMCNLKIAEGSLGDPTEAIPVIEFCLQAWRDSGAASQTQYQLGYAAALHRTGRIDDALAAIDEALRLVDAHDERFVEPELHRLRGVWTRALSDLDRAVEVARRQGSCSLELRAMVSRAQLQDELGVAVDLSDVAQLLARLDPSGSDDEPIFAEARATIQELQR